eukprot:TRINITY_DN6569_c0_g1_i1.p1 TRINITY_DN6569_c0_g1~~TRINITY_DN6569_c0_g1_i1.p1  ORF type:complete len:178 (-),score=46.25 TRINITY_DN6569_c0_g1_i1:97-630(-)
MWVVLVLVGCCLGLHVHASGGGTGSVEDLLGKRRRLKDAFTPKNSCTGSVTLRDEKGKEYVVNNTELNVNFKPSSIELLGSCCYYLYQHSTRQAGKYQLLVGEGQVKPGLVWVGSVFKTPCKVQSGSVLMTVFLVLGCLLLAVILGFLISKLRTKRRGGLVKLEPEDIQYDSTQLNK